MELALELVLELVLEFGFELEIASMLAAVKELISRFTLVFNSVLIIFSSVGMVTLVGEGDADESALVGYSKVSICDAESSKVMSLY